MSTEFEEALMGLDFAQHPPDMTTKNVMYNIEDKQKQQISRLKKRIIAVNVLVSKYHNNDIMLSTTENLLTNLKLECKRARDEHQETCKEYKSAQNRCAELEKEVALLQNKCKQLEMERQTNDSKEAAAESYTNQLQELVKDREITIEALKLEINLEKDGSLGCQKKITKLNRIITFLIKQLANVAGVVFRKKILNKPEKMKLYKYWKTDRLLKEKVNRQKICELLEEELTSEDLIMFEDFMSEPEDTACEDNMVNCSTIDEIEKGDDSDTSISGDTGRGSSLACSDKGFVSPTCFNDSQSTIKTVNNKNKHADSIADTTLVGPITVKETKEIATSPIRLERSDQATTPLKFDSSSRTDIPDIVVTIDGSVNSLKDNINEIIDGVEPLSSVIDKQALNKNSHLHNENSYDGEVEMILENMRVGLDLVTPIPTTPARSISRSTVISRANRDSQNETARMLEIKAEIRAEFKNMGENLLQNIMKKVDEKMNEFQNYLKRTIKNVPEDTISINIENIVNPKPGNEKISEKNYNNSEKECGEQLDDALLDEDPIILNHSYNKQKENENETESSAVSPNLKSSQKLLFTDELSQNKDSDEVDVIDTTDNVEQSPRKQDKKPIRVKKLTKLEKLRKDFLPKSKIKKDYLPRPRKLRSRLIVPITQQTDDVPAASLNNKEAYEKAVKIMTEIKSKQKDSKTNNKKNDNSEKNCYNQDLNGSLNPTVAKSSKKLINVRSNQNSEYLDDSNEKGNQSSYVSINDGYDNKREKSMSPMKKVQARKRQNSGVLVQSQIERVETRGSGQSTESNDSIPLAELLSLSPRRKNSNSEREERRNTTEIEEKSSPKLDCVKISNRTKYPSFSLDKDVVVVIDQSDIQEQIKRIVDVNLNQINGSRRLSVNTAVEKSMLRTRPSTDKPDSNKSRRSSENEGVEKTTPMLRARPSTDKPDSNKSRRSSENEGVEKTTPMLRTRPSTDKPDSNKSRRLSENASVEKTTPTLRTRPSTHKPNSNRSKYSSENEGVEKTTPTLRARPSTGKSNSNRSRHPSEIASVEKTTPTLRVRPSTDEPDSNRSRHSSENAGVEKTTPTLRARPSTDKPDSNRSRHSSENAGVEKTTPTLRARPSTDKPDSNRSRHSSENAGAEKTTPTVRARPSTDKRDSNRSRRSSEKAFVEKTRESPSTDKPVLEGSDSKLITKSPSDDKTEACASKRNLRCAPKRILRSFIQSSLEDKVDKETVNIHKCKQNDVGMTAISPNHAETNYLPSIISYTDLDLFSDEPAPKKQRLQDQPAPKKQRLQDEPALKKQRFQGEPASKKQQLQYDPLKSNNDESMHESIFCQIIEKHGINSLKIHRPKINDAVVDLVHEKIEKGILQINELPLNNNKREMNNLVESLKRLKYKDFLSGLLKYLADPQRKLEQYNKVNTPPAPPMTKSEQVLLYLVMKLRGAWPNVDIVNQVLKHIEYHLFKLNATPDFEVIESMARFFAILCRYINSKSRLKLFMLDSMYCMSFKAIPLIKQCLEVWMHIMPLAHMGTAKSPLVTSIVYLLHYYKTKVDKFNNVQGIRNILSQRYFFKVTEWNENRILEMFKNAILDLKESPEEKKMLRLALIILAKRQGARWCQTKLITNLLQPLINRADVSERVKTFCVSLLGPLVKPYPMDMKVHREIILNQLLDLLDTNLSPAMAEAVFISLISINRHNQNRVIEALLKWQPDKVSQELKAVLKDFVKEKPVKTWMKLLRQIYSEKPNC